MKPVDTAAAVERLEAELNSAKARMSELEDAAFLSLAEKYAGTGDALLFHAPLSPDGARKLADAVGAVCGGLAAVFAGEGQHYNYALVRRDGADITPQVKALNAALHGRGGGRNGFAQGSVSADKAEIQAFFSVSAD